MAYETAAAAAAASAMMQIRKPMGVVPEPHMPWHTNATKEQKPDSITSTLLTSEQVAGHDEGIEVDLERPKLVAVRRNHRFIDDILLKNEGGTQTELVATDAEPEGKIDPVETVWVELLKDLVDDISTMGLDNRPVPEK